VGGPAARILYVDTCLGIAGGQTSLLGILRFLDRSRFHPVVSSPPQSDLKIQCRRLGITWLPLPFHSTHVRSGSIWPGLNLPLDLLRSLYGVSYLAGLIERQRIDLVHANTFKAALVGAVSAFLSARPLVFHDRILITHGFLGKVVASSARRIIAVSQAVASKPVNRGKPKVCIVNDGVDTEILKPRSQPGPGLAVCYLGRISREKGLHNLVQCAPRVRAAVPGVRFIIAGAPYTAEDVRYLAEVRTALNRMDVVGAFEFRGYVSDIGAFMSEAAVLVLPSDREAFGIAILEAMALERPVVAFRAGGPQEIIRHGREGLLVEPADVEGLAQALVSLLRDPESAQQMGRWGRQTVEQRFSIKTAARQVMEVYEDIMGMPSAA
jgi:glycosyltransferase involved in cell wall biosynthesis